MIYHTYDISSYKIHGVKWFNVKCFWKLYFKYFWKPGIHLVCIGIMKEDIHKLQLQLCHPRCLNKEFKMLYSERSKLLGCRSPDKSHLDGKTQVAAEQFHSDVISFMPYRCLSIYIDPMGNLLWPTIEWCFIISLSQNTSMLSSPRFSPGYALPLAPCLGTRVCCTHVTISTVSHLAKSGFLSFGITFQPSHKACERECWSWLK